MRSLEKSKWSGQTDEMPQLRQGRALSKIHLIPEDLYKPVCAAFAALLTGSSQLKTYFKLKAARVKSSGYNFGFFTITMASVSWQAASNCESVQRVQWPVKKKKHTCGDFVSSWNTLRVPPTGSGSGHRFCQTVSRTTRFIPLNNVINNGEKNQ